MKRLYSISLLVAAALTTGCTKFFDGEPDDFISNGAVYGDEKLASAAVANFYGRVNWGQSIDNDKSYIYLDEACLSNGSPDNTLGFGNDFMRVYDYKLIREMNEFLAGIRSDAGTGLGGELRRRFEGEVRFLRAWTYFNMARSLGGMPLIGDRVIEYRPGMDVSEIQFPRSTEAGIYDYVISECSDIADNFLGEEPGINGARAVKWTALALKARAALYAGSIARYNSTMATPLQTANNEVGIPASRADYYYGIALEAARAVISSNRYELYDLNPDKGRNFYEATSIKENNREVIWSFDHVYPGSVTMFSANNAPTSVAEEESSSNITPILNLVEAFEYVDDRDGTLRTYDAGGSYIIYDSEEELFAGKDPRLWGTVIYPGAEFKDEKIVFQAGRVSPSVSGWVKETGAAGSSDAEGNVITGINGPVMTNDGQRNKSGFCIRKFLDEAPKASTRQGSAMWFINFRYAEILMIACEASFELGEDADALDYINRIRRRAGISELNGVTLDDIVRERRVEFAFENHRYWDMKRWRRADKVWNGDENSMNTVHYALFPFRINNPGQPDHGKWIFEKQKAHMTIYPKLFEPRNYYNFLDQEWLSNNPKLTKNPYQ